MKTYHTIKKDGVKYHYRITGNRFGWNISVVNDAMLDAKLWTTAGKAVKYPFWTQPINKKEREAFYKNLALDLAHKYL